LLVGHAGDLSEHFQSVGVHDGDAAEGGALLEGLDEEGSGRLELDLRALELGELGGVLDLLSSGFLGLLPQDLGHLARNLGRAAEDDRGVPRLEDARVLLDGDHGGELLRWIEDTLLLDVDDVSGGDLLVLLDTLDGQTDGVAGTGALEFLLVLLDGEDLLALETCGDDTDDVARAERTLFDGPADDLTHTLDVINTGDGETERELGVTLGGLDEVIEGVDEGEPSGLLLGADVCLPPLVPRRLVALLDEVVAVEPRVRDEGDLLGLEADHLEHLDEFFLDLVEPVLGPVAGIHLVHADDDLLDTQQVQETSVLASLALFNTHLGVGLGDGGFKATLLGGDEKETDIGGGGASDHVLDVILVSGGVDDGVVVLVGEKLLGVALDRHTTLALLFTGVEVVGEAERGLSLLVGHRLELRHFTFGDAAALEDQVAARGGLAGIDVPAHNNGEMLFGHGG